MSSVHTELFHASPIHLCSPCIQSVGLRHLTVIHSGTPGFRVPETRCLWRCLPSSASYCCMSCMRVSSHCLHPSDFSLVLSTSRKYGIVFVQFVKAVSLMTTATLRYSLMENDALVPKMNPAESCSRKGQINEQFYLFSFKNEPSERFMSDHRTTLQFYML